MQLRMCRRPCGVQHQKRYKPVPLDVNYKSGSLLSDHVQHLKYPTCDPEALIPAGGQS